jgi:hypothetical protein
MYSNQFSFVRAEQPQMLPLPRSYLMNHVRLLYLFQIGKIGCNKSPLARTRVFDGLLDEGGI